MDMVHISQVLIYDIDKEYVQASVRELNCKRLR